MPLSASSSRQSGKLSCASRTQRASGIGQPDDPRPAVARAAVVAELELLADDDVASRLREGTRRRESHHPGSDDDDLCVEGGHAGRA